MLFVIMFIKIRLNYIDLKNINIHIYVCNLSQSIPVSMSGVWCRALYGVLRTHSTFRDEDIPLLYKGNLCDYVDNS